MNITSRAGHPGLQLFERACVSAVEESHMRFAWIGLVDLAHSRIVPVTAAGKGYGYLDQIFIDINNTPFGRGPAGRAAREGRPRAAYDIARDADYWPWMAEALSRGYRSAAAVPIRLGGKVAAVLGLYAPIAGHFDVVQLVRFERMAAGISQSFDAERSASD
jgi:HTH-type transcriptional regulator, bacterioopsin transcriptional activator and related proteins